MSEGIEPGPTASAIVPAEAPRELTPFERGALGVHGALFIVGALVLVRHLRRRRASRPPEGVPEAAWTPLAVAALLLALPLLGLLAGGVQRSLFGEASLPQSVGIGAALTIAWAWVAVHLIGRFGQPWREAFGLARAPQPAARWGLFYWLMAFPVFYGLKMATELIVRVLGHTPDVNPAALALLELKDPASIALVVFATCVVAPVGEEVVFRGFVYGGSRGFMGRGPALAFTAFAFALLHPSVDWPAIAALSVALCYAYERTGSLVAPIAAHALNNLYGVSLLFAQRVVEG